ncbi:MAG TPA: NADH oxidase, partial [Candidatus Deferrimicrobiaceae bacterium]
MTKNRIKYNATVTNYCYRDGFVSPTEEAYIEAQARGGPGIVTSGGSYTDPKEEQKGYVNQMGCFDDKFIPGMAKLADIIHKYDAVACFQVMPCGRYGGADLDYCVGPSAVPQSTTAYKPMRAFSTEEVYVCIQQCIDAFRRAAEAGFDVGELGGHVGYLVSNFVSKFTNRRTDEFGGDIKGRMKFVTDIIKGTHKVLGEDWPIGIRLSYGENLGDKGNTLEEGLESMKIA